jgi:hypothetical protein
MTRLLIASPTCTPCYRKRSPVSGSHSGTQADPQHQRLIDYFKRVYAIVAGLALTDACRRTLPLTDYHDPRLRMFLAFFVTIVPIFHGGDRSLDQKYFASEPSSPVERFWFVWDD